ncbi:MAG TPA: dihydrofolate synthase [Chitinophagaceae bacterium]|nr:dihydrofolate synthase [Chitinophagaceae bacterium]
MQYEAAIQWLYEQLPMFGRVGAAAYKKDITNTIALCNAIGNPQEALTCIHVAGTNGKGSTSHMLASVLQSAGYKVGLYTSPHLKDFRERIKINGTPCGKSFIATFVSNIQATASAIRPSFFEVTVAMAFAYFKQEQVDVAIIETGLGGRLDSTNIIKPIISVITNIGWDHMQLLGNTLPAIASEKAGIIKQQTPIVIGTTNALTAPVFEAKALTERAPLFFADQLWELHDWHYTAHTLQVTISRKGMYHDDRHTYNLDLSGLYQKQNVLTVAEALYQLQILGWPITQQHIQHGLQHVKQQTGLYGRWQVLKQSPMLIADVGHNVDGMEQIVQQLALLTYRRLHIVTGMVHDKDVDAVLATMPQHAQYYFTQAQIPRALAADALQQQALMHGLYGNTYENVDAAVAAALQHANETDVVLVCGSVFLVGELSQLQVHGL